MTENQRTRLQQQKELFLERFESMNLQQQLPIVQIIKLYESMNPKGQQKLMEYAQDMLSLPRYKKRNHPASGRTGYGIQRATEYSSAVFTIRI